MKLVLYWRWRLVSQTHGKLYTTRHLMTEEAALAIDPQAQRIESTRTVIEVAETLEETYARGHSTGRFK